MERPPLPCPDTPARPDLDGHRAWLLVLLALCVGHAWTVLSLFAAPEPGRGVADGTFPPLPSRDTLARSWHGLTDDRPVVSGRHPLHLYFGYLGARSLRERGTFCCYDPAFQAGYPKTPVFDSGSRPAELFLLLGGAGYRPAAYKVGLAVCCALAPLLLALAGWGAGLGRGTTCLAVLLGLLVWGGGPCRHALEDGDLDWLVASLAGLAHVCLLVRFHRAPGPGAWLALLLTGCVGWFAHPCLLALLTPFLLLYYLGVGPKHQAGWHLALFAGPLLALLVNSFWLADWVQSWWIRLPLQLGAAPLKHRTFHTLWAAPLWGDAADRAVAVLLFVLAAAGVTLLNHCQSRSAARLLGLGAGGFLVLAVAGTAWPPLGRLGAAMLLLPALWFAVVPAAFAVTRLLRCTGCPYRGTALAAAALAALLYAGHDYARHCAVHWLQAPPLAIGLAPEQAELVELLRRHTTPEARVLWEDRRDSRLAPRWSALLPLLTGRAFVGGLDPDGTIEHAYAGFQDQALAGRPIADWSDADLEDYCRRYNVGWVVCWSPAVVARFQAWAPDAAVLPVADEGPGYLFVLKPRSFVLKGRARWLGADRQRVVLADVEPEDGEVVLALHYQAGLQASPARVAVEREPDPFDPIPFVRLRVPGPVARVTLTWEPDP